MHDLVVLFATHNGEAVLPLTLEGYTRQVAPGVSWKIVVVDNASTDRTPEILRAFQSRLPLEIISQPVPGKNRSLNAALPSLDTEFAIISDDDAIPAPDFLAEWQKTNLERSTHDLFGGRIEPHFQVQPQAWMRDNRFEYVILFAERDLPEGPIPAIDIFGPNMAVRTKLFRAGIHFNESIGPDGSNPNYGMGSETEFCQRVEAAGHPAWFAAGPAVQHVVRPHQVTEKFWLGRAYRHGYGYAQRLILTSELNPAAASTSLKLAKYKIRQALLRLSAKLHPSALGRNRSRWQHEWRRGFRQRITDAL